MEKHMSGVSFWTEPSLPLVLFAFCAGHQSIVTVLTLPMQESPCTCTIVVRFRGLPLPALRCAA